MYNFNFDRALVDDGGSDFTPVQQTSTQTPAIDSRIALSRLTSGQTLTNADRETLGLPPKSTATPKPTLSSSYLDYRTGERQSSVVDEQTKIQGMRDAAKAAAKMIADNDELAQDKARAKQAQIDLEDAMTKAKLDALAREAAKKAAEEAARKAAEDEANNQSEEDNYDYYPSTVSNTTPSTPVSPTPLTPSNIGSKPSNISPVTQTPPPPPVKTAPIDTILFDEEAVPIQIMSDLIFENIGGQELIDIARNDTINGQKIIYQPIKNLTSIQQEYNPNNIVALQATSDKYFQNFSIKFENKVPQVGSGPNGEHVYINNTNGNLVIELVNLDSDEQVEVEITTSGTIYEAEL